MKRLGRKLLSFALVLIMVLTMIPTAVFATEAEMTLRASEASAVAGSKVTAKLELEDNPGIASLRVKVAFDDILTLTNVEFNDDMGGQYQMPQTMKSPVTLAWFNGTENFVGENATFVTLTFEVSEDAIAGDVAELIITHDPSDVYDITETDIPLNVVNGIVTIQDCVPGDINGDGSANMKDLTRLFQYLADWEVEVNEPALDTNGDGSVNMKDQTRLFQYFADWDVVLYPIVNKKCDHVMTAVEYKAATCTEDGNIAYWYCSECEKYFTNENGIGEISAEDTVLEQLGHDPVVIPAVDPTATSSGWTEGSKCGRADCGQTLVAPVEIPPIVEEVREITYDLENGDLYLATQNIENPNNTYISTTSTYTLKNPVVPGYTFLGWYDLPAGENAEIVKTITPGNEDLTLYAHWEKKVYKLQFKSSLYQFDSITYTVDTGAVLPERPQLSNYVFAGWSDEDGNMYEGNTIPVGTTGHITLTANWVSERNKAVTKTNLGEPLIYEDGENGFIYFTYEIGKIENVPLQVIHDFGYISGDGVTKTATETYTMTVDESMMEAYSSTVSEATIQSSNWTLSNGWSENTTVDKEWLEQTGMTEAEATEKGTSESSNWNVGSSRGGSHATTKLDTKEAGWANEVKVEESKEVGIGTKIAAGLEVTAEADVGVAKSGMSASLDAEFNSSYNKSSGLEVGGAKNGTKVDTSSTEDSSTWNSSSSYGGSKTSSKTESVSKELSKLIAENHRYGESYIKNEDVSNSQGMQSSTSSDEEYSTTVTYSKIVGTEQTRTWTTEATKPGYHRWILVGTAHVYGVVGYDIANKAYFVNTFSVMDDEMQEFEDYSYVSGSYSDHENGVISFEVPDEVIEYVSDKVSASDGLKINQVTGEITGYTGTDNCVVIPEYMNVGDGDVIKVTGITSTAFAGNTNILAVILSDFITEIPENAFAGCTALEGIFGGSITTIKSGAFRGCTAIAELGISQKITTLGENAFVGVNKLLVKPINATVLNVAINSGAKNVVVNMGEFATNASSLNGLNLTVPEGTETFEINGCGRTYTGLSVTSNAEKTVLKKINLIGNGAVPLTASSTEVDLNQASIQTSGLGMVLMAPHTKIGLQSTINVSTVKCREIELYETHASVNGLLAVSDTLYTTNATIKGQEYLQCSNIVLINDASFDTTLHTCQITFNANGGTLSEADTKKTVTIGKEYGTLPTPSRTGYNFAGWFTAASGGTQITASTKCSGATTLYAHWSVKAYTASWSNVTGCTIAVNRTSSPYAGAATGSLSSGTTVYYGDVLSVTYTAGTAYNLNTKGSTSITVTGNVTSSHIYATTSVKSYKLTWSTATGCSITVKRTSSPYAGAATGVCSSGGTIYYGDVLSITYTANAGYTLATKGSTSITVTGNVTSSNIYATATPNSYTYNIVYKSANGTSLGSTTATYKFGTTNTITPPAKTGYTTPAAQSVKWDSTSAKTITFTYPVKDVGSTTKTGYTSVYTAGVRPGIKATAVFTCTARTKDSVTLSIKWTSTLENGYTNYGQRFRIKCGSASTGDVQVVSPGAWWDGSTPGTKTVTLKITGISATTTSVDVDVYNWQVNHDGLNMHEYDGTKALQTKWTIPIKTY